ncbi:MAG TPA: hypothetical protein VFF98_14935 [Novosphingobium sp.]|nr:hypothetical protein [Novosphingobium sp.]
MTSRLMAGTSRFAHLAGFGGRRSRRAADERDQGDDRQGRRAEEDDEDEDEDEDGQREGDGDARRSRRSRRADGDGPGEDEGDPNADPEDNQRGARRARRADGDGGDDGGDEGDDDANARGSRRSRRAEADEDDEDEEDEREMNGRSAAASARRRERVRCCAVLEAVASAMGNPPELEIALTQMESPIGRHRAVRSVSRAARSMEGRQRDNGQREARSDRSARNPGVGGTAPQEPRGAAVQRGWGAAIDGVIGKGRR